MSAFNRDALISALIAQIATTGIIVGDHIAPKEGGWSSGQPGMGEFTGYTAVFSGQVNLVPSTFCPGDLDASCQFSTRTFGTTRKQADDLALLVRNCLVGFKPDAGEYRTNMLICNSIGPNERMDDTEPKRWRVSDNYTASMVPTRSIAKGGLSRRPADLASATL